MIKYYPIDIEKDENGFYIVTCPFFNGCHSYGKNLSEAILNINEAIDLCSEENKQN